ncbi:DUF4418 family protein [Eubacterium oxidoreducens]|uniref:Uncharacterized protein n=1 Tax=Eubacterium oxidoreducens TaxID=1732 RepID=A0A1G6C232_EUBOX|nr:DUF4418 family protein [Eubacterium oxidoreducens]SDB26914.1 protein of unknown function [Eubacterium oxidoreducens]
MKKLLGIIVIIAGIFLVVAPQTFFAPCDMDGAACTYMAKAVQVIGVFVVLNGLTGFVIKENKAYIWLGIVTTITGIIGELVPQYFGYCDMKTMACVVGTVPATQIASAIVIVVGVLYILASIISSRRNHD